MSRKRKKIDLVTFRAYVVELETYDSNGRKLYHATLDSMPNEPKRQAQFFGLDKQLFKPGEVHVVTFSKSVGLVSGSIKNKNKAEIQAERNQQIQEVMDKLETQTIN